MGQKAEKDLHVFDVMEDKARGKLLKQAAKLSFEIIKLLNSPQIGARSSEFLPIINLMERSIELSDELGIESTYLTVLPKMKKQYEKQRYYEQTGFYLEQ